MSHYMAADFMLQDVLIKMNSEGLAKSLIERDIKYNGTAPSVDEFKRILTENLKSKYPQMLSELFTGNVQ